MKITQILLALGVTAKRVAREPENEDCPKGYFKLETMKECHKQLDCSDMEQIK